jgi:hypothetical protein
MLNMTTGMLVNDLKAAVELVRRGGEMPATAPAKPPQAAVSKPKEEPIGKTVDVNKIIHAGPLAKVFQGFQDSLALAIGPISEMVIKDTVEIWAQNGECSQARLPELVEMLVKEIDDPSLEAEFKLAVKKYLI